MLTDIAKRFATRLKLAAKDEDGTLTVEFIVMLPLLAFWFIGAITFFEAYRSNSLTAKVAYTISDIASKYGEGDTLASQSITQADLEELFQIQQRMMPRRASRGNMRISSVCWFEDDDPTDGSGTDESEYRILWSWVGDTSASAEPNLVPLTTDDIPTSIMPIMGDETTVVFVEVFANWEPISEMGGILKPLTWSNRLTERPRLRPEGIPFAPSFTDTLCGNASPGTV